MSLKTIMDQADQKEGFAIDKPYFGHLMLLLIKASHNHSELNSCFSEGECRCLFL